MNTRSFNRFWPVSGTITHRFGVSEGIPRLTSTTVSYVSFMNTRSFNRFWPVSWTITHRFGVSEGIPRLTTQTVRLRVVHEHSQFYPILARFVDYYSPFWGIGGNSTIDDPNGAFTCRS